LKNEERNNVKKNDVADFFKLDFDLSDIAQEKFGDYSAGKISYCYDRLFKIDW
jgi:hypothetical protein